MNFRLSYKKELLILGLLIFLYFIFRLPNLTLQPIFADEAIYIRWAQVMKAEPTLRFLPLSDGKTPLFMWLMTPLFKIFDDPLFAGRFLSALSGIGTLTGVIFLGWRFFNKKVAYWSALLVTVTPYIVFFDRLALVDSILTAFSVWSLNFALLLIRYQRLDVAMILGYFLGAGLLTKPPGIFNILTVPVTLITFNWARKDRERRIITIFFLLMIALGIGLGIYNLLRLGPGFDNLSSRNQDYLFSPTELWGRVLDPFLPHLGDIFDWFPKLFTIPILGAVLGGIVTAVAKRHKVALVVLLWSLLPLMVQMAFLRTFTARYLLFSIAPLLLLGGWFISLISERLPFRSMDKFVTTPLLLIILLPLALYFNFQLLTNPAQAPLPGEERRGYLEDWTAGYGFAEIAKFLEERSKNGVVIVGTEGSFGTLPDGLMIYLDKHSHTAPETNKIIVIGGKATVSAQLRDSALRHQTYFVANESRFRGADNLKLLKEYPKAKSVNQSQDAILFFQILPPGS